MTTILAAEQVLASAMRAAGIEIPEWATVAEVATWRVVESRLERLSAAGTPLARAHAAYRRAQNAERKALSAAYRAKWAVPAAPPAPPPPRRRKATQRKMTIAAYIADARAA